jgi:hypothetical protein
MYFSFSFSSVSFTIVIRSATLVSCTLLHPLATAYRHLPPPHITHVTHHPHYPASTDLFQSFTSHVVSGNCINVAALTRKEQMFEFHKDPLGSVYGF